MATSTDHMPIHHRLVARARRVAYLLGFLRGPVWAAVAVAAGVTVAGRLALAWGLEAELLTTLGAACAALRWVAAVRRWALWLRNRWRTHGPGSGDTETPGGTG